jgi:hypothetical protein
MPQIKPVYNCNFISPIEMPPVLLGKVIFGTKKKWTYKTGDLLKEVQFI